MKPHSRRSAMPSTFDALAKTPTALCGGCRSHGSCRLGVGPIMLRPDGATASLVCAETFHAGPRVAHGGWTAAVFDDVMGRSLVQGGVMAVTGTLTTDFLKPVPVEEPLEITVSIDGHEGRRWMLSSALRLAGGDVPLARARGVWVERRDDHFERHEAALRAHRETRGEQ